MAGNKSADGRHIVVTGKRPGGRMNPGQWGAEEMVGAGASGQAHPKTLVPYGR